MSGVVAIGETHQLEGFALVGVSVNVPMTDREITEAWQNLPPDTGLAILSSLAAATLESMLAERPDVLTVVMP